MRCLIVGSGLAAIAMAEHLRTHDVAVDLISVKKKGASIVAAGILNPTVLKRYTAAWKSSLFIDYALPFYRTLEDVLQQKLFEPLPIHRVFNTPAEANDWMVAADHPSLAPFLEAKIQASTTSPFFAPNGYGRLLGVGRLNIQMLINGYTRFLGNQYTEAYFDHSKLNLSTAQPKYNGVSYDHLFFCEGYQLKNNPWFGDLPLTGTKGEMLLIRSEQLPKNAIWKGPIFIAPVDAQHFWVGASFNWTQKNDQPTQKDRIWLEKKLNQMVRVPYQIVGHMAGVRPTVIDRRPLLGTHPKHHHLHVFNGLGTRGGLMAPLLAKWLYQFVFEEKSLHQKVSISRFAQLPSS